MDNPLPIGKQGEIDRIRAAALIIKDGRLLVAKNTGTPYYTIGGGVGKYETTEAAAIREVYEETGLKLEVDRLAFINESFFEFDGRKFHEIGFYYLMKDNPDINIPEGSFTDQPPFETLHWLPIDGLKDADLVPPFLKEKALGSITGIEHVISWR